MDFGERQLAKNVGFAVLVVYELHIGGFELADDDVLPQKLGEFRALVGVDVLHPSDVIQATHFLGGLVYHFHQLFEVLRVLENESFSLVEYQKFDAGQEVTVDFVLFLSGFVTFLASQESDCQG